MRQAERLHLQMKSFCRVNVQKEKIAILAHIRQIILAFQEQKFYLEEPTVEREKGSTVEVECTLTIEEGEAIIFLQSGNNDPTVILQANDTFTGKFEVGNGSSYFGIWGEEFTGSAELNIE